jgi:hypothetical protein
MADDTPTLQEVQQIFAAGNYANRSQAAVYLSARLNGRITVDNLHSWGKAGPRYFLLRGNKKARGGGWGRWAVYTQADLEAWIEANLKDPFEEERANGHCQDLACTG